MQGHAEWSPDGTELVMFGGPRRANPRIYITSDAGQDPRQVTDRPGREPGPELVPGRQSRSSSWAALGDLLPERLRDLHGPRRR